MITFYSFCIPKQSSVAVLDSFQRAYCRDLPSPECGVKD